MTLWFERDVECSEHDVECSEHDVECPVFLLPRA